MSTLNDLHGKVPPPPVHVVPLGSSTWDVQTVNRPWVRLATCRDRNVADYIAALWNLMPPIEAQPPVRTAEFRPEDQPMIDRAMRRPYRRRKAGKSVQVMP